jgi:hypothetical protein
MKIYFSFCCYLEMFSKNSVFYEFNRIVSIISIILYSTGIIGNILSISICLRKKLRMVPTFIFMASISILNIIKLFTIFTCVLIFEFKLNAIKELNTISFNIFLFIIFWKHHSTAYLMVSFEIYCVLQ